jgi:iron complex transport system substrate-binding protein
MYPPERIICLTEETTETLYLLGEQHRIVGISGYTVRPPQARKEKPRVSHSFLPTSRKSWLSNLTWF